MAKIYAKPVEGLVLPLPDGAPWPAKGAFVELDRFVRRRLAAGDIVETDPPSDDVVETADSSSTNSPFTGVDALDSPFTGVDALQTATTSTKKRGS